jgi:hypothetical protein
LCSLDTHKHQISFWLSWLFIPVTTHTSKPSISGNDPPSTSQQTPESESREKVSGVPKHAKFGVSEEQHMLLVMKQEKVVKDAWRPTFDPAHVLASMANSIYIEYAVA